MNNGVMWKLVVVMVMAIHTCNHDGVETEFVEFVTENVVKFLFSWSILR
jgi:hypothetical protein